MGISIDDRAGGGQRGQPHGVVGVMSLVLAMASVGCAAAPARRPSEPLSSGQPTWPEDVVKEAERVDRVCGTRETRLLSDY